MVILLCMVLGETMTRIPCLYFSKDVEKLEGS